MNRALSSIRIAAAFVAVAIVVAGCSAVNNATSSQASSQGEQPYKTMYGISSEGTTTDLYTEFFGPRQPPPAPATAVAAAQPTQPVTTQPITPAQPATAMQPATTTRATRSGQTTAAAAKQQAQPVPAPPPPMQVAQPPAPPPPPPEPDVPAAYGITANGPTTDLYTMIFGPRRSDSQ